MSVLMNSELAKSLDVSYRERGKDRDFPTSGSITWWTQTLGLSQAKARSSIAASHMVAGTECLGYLVMFYPSHLQGVDSKVRQPGLKTVPLWDSSITGCTCHCHSVGTKT